MRIAVVDDEEIILEGTMRTLRRCWPKDEVIGFQDPVEALVALTKSPCDVVFLDIDMPGLDGMYLARQLKMASPQTNLIFATAYPQFANEALDLHASGYLLKPLTEEVIRREMTDLRYPVELSKDKGLYVKAFGNFDVFFNGNPVRFRYTKTKELFAYLIDRRGNSATNQEIQSVMWEDGTDKTSYLKQLRKDLADRLDECRCGSILIKRRGCMSVAPDKIDCDYYEWIRGTARGINAYNGEYMSQYRWAETTRTSLDKTDG